MAKVIGILGGLGPQTTAKFYLKLVELCTRTTRPAISIWNLPLNIKKESEYIRFGKHKRHYLALMKGGLRALEGAGSDFVVIPCNTVHEFYATLVGSASVPVVNLIEVVAEEAKSKKWSKVLLLATSQTVKTGLYQGPLEKRGVEIVLPSQDEQTKLDGLVQELLDEKGDDVVQSQFLRALVDRSGCKNVVLGCTDLQLVFPADESYIDSMEALAKHTATLLRGQ
jgi:aspartate racemase